MARRGTNHSFNKRQKERKRKEKAEKKQERRLLKKQSAANGTQIVAEEDANETAVDLARVEADSQAKDPPSSDGHE